MQCNEIQRLIPALIDDLLDEEDAAEVRRHMNRCQDCLSLFHAYQSDMRAILEHSRRAPWIPVANDVIDRLPGQRSPWWGRIAAGGNQLATVAGVAIVLLVVFAGAFALREMADSENTSEPEIMVGVDDQNDRDLEPVVLSEDEIDQVIDRLDENGLVYHLGVGTSNDGYAIDFERIAFDRHLTLVEYRADADTASDVEFQIRSDTGEHDTYTVGLDEGTSFEGWMVLSPVSRESSVIGVQLQQSNGAGTDVAVDLSAIPVDADTEEYATEDYNSGIELCCLEVERGAAVSLLSWDYEILERDELVPVESSDEQADLDADARGPAPYPSVSVNGEPVSVMSHYFGLSRLDPGRHAIGVFDLPASGDLELEYEYVTVIDGGNGEEHDPESFVGPWTLTATLEPVDVSPEPTPEPTTPPDVAEDPTPTPEPTPAPDEEDEVYDGPTVLVYLLRDEEIAAASRAIDDTPQVGTAAMEHLLAGLTDEEEEYGLFSAIYEGAELNSLSIEDGVATVDLNDQFYSGGGSAAAIMRIAQVVFTLTQFETVDEVSFLVDGQPVDGAGDHGIIIEEPMDRGDFEDFSPTILIEGPTPGTVIQDEVRLHGTSNTFEATLQIEIIDAAGEILYEDHAMATSGTGERGTFDLTVPIEPTVDGMGKVVMFEYSARDGSRVNDVEIPVEFRR